MKRADEAVEKVLAGLREAEAAPGLEERIERRVREAARERWVLGWFGVWQWVGVGCVAMLMVGVGVNLRRQGKHDVFATNAGVGRDTRVQAKPDGVGAVQEGVSQGLKPSYRLSGDGTAQAVSSSRAGISSVSKSEVAEVLNAGFPAPPLPLTAQERLLLRAARGGEPIPAAVLEISVLPTHDAEETAAFVDFFKQDRQVEQSKPGESE